ncbi:lachesin, partial [Cryptotermes secundus]|uniref:lachesin n=1 Tax=Cryptotermes secundus TaxID=105785 RepID=UPI001454B85C
RATSSIILLLLLFCRDSGSSYVSGGYGQGTGAGFNSLQPAGSPAPPPPPPPSLGRNEPYFDTLTPRNVTALVGKSAYLSCRVRNLGNKTVSWIRHRDIHILTVGGYTYTSDQRFQANHHRDNEDWTLQIKWAQKRDAGIYECQISTQPVRSYFVNLNIVEPPTTKPQWRLNEDFYQSQQSHDDLVHQIRGEIPTTKPRWRLSDDLYQSHQFHDGPIHQIEGKVPTATILGGPDLHVDKGSTINLTCTIKYSPEPPAYIFWYHHDEVISYDSSRGGVSVITEKGDVTTSYLLIQHAEVTDSGKYSCSPSNADVASVKVHVLNGERRAAMQTGSAALSKSSLGVVAHIVLCLLYCVVLGQIQLNDGRLRER